MAVLLRYSSQTDTAVGHQVPALPSRRLGPTVGLYWYDVSWGLLTCLPFEEEPVLEFVPIPRTARDRLSSSFCFCTTKDIQFFACFAVSTSGIVRFVKIRVPARPKVIVQRVRRTTQRHGEGKDPWVTMYSLRLDDDSGSWSWRLDHEVSFKEHIWSHHTYEASGLPKKTPKLACVDPFNADIVYFLLGRFVFNIDLTSGALDKCTRFSVKKPPMSRMSSRFILACPY